MLSKIRLELARTKDFSEGSRDTGCEFTAPLKSNGKIDAEDDETDYRFSDHGFKFGEHVSVKEGDGLGPYQVKHIEELK